MKFKDPCDNQIVLDLMKKMMADMDAAIQRNTDLALDAIGARDEDAAQLMLSMATVAAIHCTRFFKYVVESTAKHFDGEDLELSDQIALLMMRRITDPSGVHMRRLIMLAKADDRTLSKNAE